MEIVVRTPHGDADVSVLMHGATTTLGDVVSAVTGQAVPRLVLIDGRTVDASTLLDDAELILGSIVTSEPPAPEPVSGADVDLVQIAGHGAGRATRLGPGRYRIGPGRRSNAQELGVAPVERAAFELVVEPSTTLSTVVVVPGTDAVAIDGTDLSVDTTWSDGTLTVGSRAFQLDNPVDFGAPRGRSMPDRDGSVAFSRPPRRRSPRPRRPVVDAVRDAMHTSPSLWERRPGHADAFALPVGVGLDRPDVVTIDLAADRAVAITGPTRWRNALARTVIVEAVTLHGPADIDLTVLTGPDGVAEWDWAKWLPHLRPHRGRAGPPSIWSTRHDIARWASTALRQEPSSNSARLDVVILDDPTLWNRLDSPLRSIVPNPPGGMRLIALCDDETEAPAVCTTAISQRDGDLARLHSFTRADDGIEVRVALTEIPVARVVARALAPLADVELPDPDTPAAVEFDPVELSHLVGATETDHVIARWDAGDPRPTVTLGRTDAGDVDVSIADDVTVVIGQSLGDAFDIAATSLLSQCVDRSPEELWIVPAMSEVSPRSELLWMLPHATDRHDADSVIDPRRLLARLDAVLTDPDGPSRVVVVAEAISTPAMSPGDGWLRTLADGVHAVDGLALIVVSDRDSVADLVGGTVIRVERLHDDAGAGSRRVATLTTGHGTSGLDTSGTTFTPVRRTTTPVAGLELCPYVIGRSLTPLERRVERLQAHAANAPDPAIAGVVELLRNAHTRRRLDETPSSGDRIAVPPPLPTRIELTDLLANSPGDGVPLGLADVPSSARARTHWWQPGDGSLLVFGSRRSGMEQVLTTILLGVLDRFSDLDVRLVVVESSSTRRRALEGLHRSIRIVAPDRPDDVHAALDEISAELDRRAAAALDAASDGLRLVVLIGDLVLLRRRYLEHSLGARLDDVLARAAVVDAGIDVIAWASELDGAGAFATDASSLLVGASSDHRELAELGVDQPSDLDGVVGRCRSFPSDDLVQLAVGDSAVESLLARRSTPGSP
jgi:hypothetical protein